MNKITDLIPLNIQEEEIILIRVPPYATDEFKLECYNSAKVLFPFNTVLILGDDTSIQSYNVEQLKALIQKLNQLVEEKENQSTNNNIF